MLNLCAGVIVDRDTKVKGEKYKLMITDAQQYWVSYRKALYVKKQFFLQTNIDKLSPTRTHLIKVVTSSMFLS